MEPTYVQTRLEVVGHALGRLKLVAIGAGVGYCPAGANRRELVFDKLGNSEIKLGRNPYGVTDKEVLVLKVVEKIYGNKLIAPAFTGASGDIDPWFRVLPEFNEREVWVPEPVLLATFLGEEIVHVCEQIKTEKSDVEIGAALVTLELPGKEEGTGEIPAEHSTTKLNVTIAKLGDIAFVGLGAEVLTENALGCTGFSWTATSAATALRRTLRQ